MSKGGGGFVYLGGALSVLVDLLPAARSASRFVCVP